MNKNYISSKQILKNSSKELKKYKENQKKKKINIEDLDKDLKTTCASIRNAL